jgi:hypothetical protein
VTDFEPELIRRAADSSETEPLDGVRIPADTAMHSGDGDSSPAIARRIGAPTFPQVQQTRIRRSGGAVIRRQIDDPTWQRRIQPVLRQGRTVTVRDAGGVKSLYFDGPKLFLQAADGTTTRIMAANLPQMRNTHDFVPEDLPEHLTTDPTDVLSESTGDGFTVNEFAGEPLSLVHHTVSDDGTNAHLTMENAHAVALYDATSTTWGDVRSKVGEDKKTINNRLGADYSIPAIDNFNFYPREKPSGGKKPRATQPLHEAMPLRRYLDFIVHAFDRCGVRREYGERMIQMAEAMAARTALDLTTVFMRVGMDESSFIRAVLAIDARLVSSGATGLVLAAADRDPFEKWWTTTANDEPVPYLHDLSALRTTDPAAAPPLAARPWVREGTTAPSGTTYASLETAYTKAHAPAFIAAVNTWTALQPAPL